MRSGPSRAGGTEAARSICLVSCRTLDGLAEDDQRLQEALHQAGWATAVAAWDDPKVRWSAHAAVVLRSTWDYHQRAEEFRAWIDTCAGAGVALWNPAATLRWNMHKGYLLELAARGVSVVPTALVARGEAPRLDALLRSRG